MTDALLPVAVLAFGVAITAYAVADHLSGGRLSASLQRHRGRHEPGLHGAHRRAQDLVIDPLTPEELALGRLDYGAESLAVNPRMFEEHTGDVADRLWRDGCDWYIEHINREFDALVADLPDSEDDPFDPGYWPPISAAPFSGPPLLHRLADFDAAATLQIITVQNDTPPVFSWTTQEYALVGAPSGNVQVAHQGNATFVRERRVKRHRRRRHH